MKAPGTDVHACGHRAPLAILLIFFCCVGSAQDKPGAPVAWRLLDTTVIANQKPQVLGHPKALLEGKLAAIQFNGVDDGLFMPVNPLGGRQQFTIALLFRPDADGPAAPRMVHGEDSVGNRFTIEARITPGGQWYLDTFLKNGKAGKGLTLIDSTRLHPCGRWYWVSLRYDGETMTAFINGETEGEGKVVFPPMADGRVAMGVRLNRVGWFKGAIGELRFYPVALRPKDLPHF